MAHPVRIKFHGVRAIHPASSIANQTTGGNTSCIELVDGESLIFINAGYGFASAGDTLEKNLSNTNAKANVTLLFSDFLWDSTLGLPFFSPIHDRSTKIKILTGSTVTSARSALDDVTSNLFSPFNGFMSLGAEKEIIQITSTTNVGSWTIKSKLISHPLTPEGATVWRLKHEHGDDIGVVLLCEKNENIIASVANFLDGCHTLICAASSEKGQDRHNTDRLGFPEALTIALASQCNNLLLTQFHPSMSDLDLQGELINLHRSLEDFKKSGSCSNLSIRLATELENEQTKTVSPSKIAV